MQNPALTAVDAFGLELGSTSAMKTFSESHQLWKNDDLSAVY
jgi:hypothetical protein